jgi:hypothetical protein
MEASVVTSGVPIKTVMDSVKANPAMVAPTKAAEVKAQHTPQDDKAHQVYAEFKYQVDLEKFLGLKKKVLLTEDEKRDKKSLLSDRAFLESLKPLLLVEAPKDKVNLQNGALDYLYEALQGDMRAEAAEVLQAVVADKTVEDTSTSLDTRKNMGGMKAEVLFRWSAIDPKATGTIAASLPGPVSKKIWDRVQEQQENNAAESRSLQASK